MSTRMATLALVSAAGLLVSSCSFGGGSQTEAEEPAFTEAAAASVTSSTKASATTSSAPSSTSSSSANANCDEKKDLEDTELSKVLENEEAYVKGSTEKFEDVSVGEDEYDPCKFLSYVVLEGEFDGEDVKVPVFFVNGRVYDEDALSITSSSFEVTEDGEGYTYESKTEGDIVGVEGKVYKRPGTEAPSMENSFDGVNSDVFFIDVKSEPSDSADLAKDEEDLRGETLFDISADGWNLVCGIDANEKSIDCAHGGGGAWVIKSDKTNLPEDMEFDVVSLLPLEGETRYSQGGVDNLPTDGKKIDSNGLYRIGIDDIEAQIAVVDDGIIISTPNNSRLMFTNDTIFIEEKDKGDGANSNTETA
ncbi:hypothetical protein [Corynebacterium hiratae]|uniref:Secreted protein n=1 Tax=Corynebacterium hiratae TaxID=3139423 RepID=A0A553FNU8_9CORY|nr:hypothetical protein [Corynebacterium aurimucosum]TRX58909.1 hypothetical protein FNY97_12450 [Corynebacterium aurimucosum]